MGEINFKDAPISLGERRGKEDVSKLSPRDLLVSMLREIDNGELNLEGVVLCYFWTEGEGTVTGLKRAQATIMQAVAMVEIAKYDLLKVD